MSLLVLRGGVSLLRSSQRRADGTGARNTKVLTIDEHGVFLATEVYCDATSAEHGAVRARMGEPMTRTPHAAEIHRRQRSPAAIRRAPLASREGAPAAERERARGIYA
jgi:hypothetical protein